MRTTVAWIWFAIVQLVCAVAWGVGLFLLIPFCLLHAWTKPDRKSIKDDRQIDRWYLINFVAGNPEDGASGQQALINGDQPYMPSTLTNPALKWLYDAWRAYRWSALRNSADGLKYLFAWKAGPYKEWTYTLFGKQRTAKVGWQLENGFNVPVISP